MSQVLGTIGICSSNFCRAPGQAATATLDIA